MTEMPALDVWPVNFGQWVSTRPEVAFPAAVADTRSSVPPVSAGTSVVTLTLNCTAQRYIVFSFSAESCLSLSFSIYPPFQLCSSSSQRGDERMVDTQADRLCLTAATAALLSPRSVCWSSCPTA